MVDSHNQKAFHAGEWAPNLYARVDLAKYHSAAALLRNFFVDYRGGASTRAGSKYVLQSNQSGAVVAPPRLIPFQASFTVGYALEFGENYIRFHTRGGPVLETAKVITGITQANPAVVTSAAHGFTNGQWVFVQNVVGMTQVNGRYFVVAGAAANTFQLVDLFGTPVNSTAYTAYASGGTAARVYTLVSPYPASALRQLKFSQNVNTMILTHPSFAPQILTLVTPTNWTIGAITFGATISNAGAAVATTLGAGAVNYSYCVTAVDVNGQEGLNGPAGALNNKLDITTNPGTNTITWGAVPGAISYNVYEAIRSYAGPVAAGVFYGFIGSTTGLQFDDTNIIPNFSETPPFPRNPFSGGVNPSVCAFFQQRLVLAAPTSAPQTFYMSQPGSYFNFNISDPVQSDDAITGSIISTQLNEIKSMVSMPGGLVILSSRQAWQVSGGGFAAPITPQTASAQSQAYNGASDVPPIVANFDILYVQAKGSSVRDLAYNFYTNIYTGTDISILSSHLFTNHQVVEWAFAEEPFKIVWAVREDGIMLALTFLKEQEVVGWAHSDTNGRYCSVCVVTEQTDAGPVDAVYTVVTRPTPPGYLYYIERFAERAFPYGAEDSWCVDCGASSAGAFPAGTLVPLSNTLGALAVINGAGTTFTAGMVGQTIRCGGGIFLVTAFIGVGQIHTTVVRSMTLVNPETGIPYSVPTGQWSLWAPATTFSGLDHLEGQVVYGVADGRPVGPFTVAAGRVTLSAPATKVILGLKYTPQLRTLILDIGEPTTIGKLKKLIAVTVRAVDTLGIQFGRTLSTLVSMKDFSGAVSSQGVTIPYNLTTVDARQPIDPLWDQDGQYYITQPLPLPATIIGVVPEIKTEDRK